MREGTKKATFNVPVGILAAVDAAVAQGAAPSKNAFVQRALAHELAELRRQERRRRWEAASRDPLFLRDLDEIGAAFESADAETAQRIG